MKRAKLLIAALACAASIVYATDYATLATRAARFFDQREWASASAMYDLMIDRRPSECGTYGYAIVSAGMRGDTLSQMSLMDRSMDGRVPLDSLCGAVEKVSFSIGESQLYERFLVGVKKRHPWLSRGIDNYLLEYYVFRNDALQMIAYSRSMLKGMPEDLRFLTILADGLMLNGQEAEAVDAYQEILRLHSDDYNALLQLGNYFHITAQTVTEREMALGYFERAQKVKPTPFVENAIKSLRAEINGAK